ncbi:Os08g0206650 [Oryza sativa Japonica Group]|uniref:Os08g0206650 protein n=1 Tax=Oryza sativa subsp. japonica TaxID=39947 RepID=A0A0P0XD17_ORYSJ|nr:hypothetical protein EE612_042729 [Oryza sativa]BAT04309.1 Os08g0206650 [Oryza sativa Japonica Group]
MIHHNKNILMILCCSDHRRSTDINVFNAILERNYTRGDLVIEWIQVHHNHIKCPYAMLIQCLKMMLLVSSCKNTTMYTGVQCFNSTIKLNLPNENL